MEPATDSLTESTQESTQGFTVALAGNPNVGKTTLFNALTGLHQKVANYPGVTVEKKTGRCVLTERMACEIIDLPGTYSLASRSPDEHVARQVVLGQIEGTPRPDVIVVVADASNLERNLYLVTTGAGVGAAGGGGAVDGGCGAAAGEDGGVGEAKQAFAGGGGGGTGASGEG